MTKGINSFCIPSQSYWTSAGSPIAYPALGRDIKVDIAIVGGGLGYNGGPLVGAGKPDGRCD